MKKGKFAAPKNPPSRPITLRDGRRIPNLAQADTPNRPASSRRSAVLSSVKFAAFPSPTQQSSPRSNATHSAGFYIIGPGWFFGQLMSCATLKVFLLVFQNHKTMTPAPKLDILTLRKEARARYRFPVIGRLENERRPFKNRKGNVFWAFGAEIGS